MVKKLTLDEFKSLIQKGIDGFNPKNYLEFNPSNYWEEKDKHFLYLRNRIGTHFYDGICKFLYLELNIPTYWTLASEPERKQFTNAVQKLVNVIVPNIKIKSYAKIFGNESQETLIKENSKYKDHRMKYLQKFLNRPDFEDKYEKFNKNLNNLWEILHPCL
jgi:hypothetical protein